MTEAAKYRKSEIGVYPYGRSWNAVVEAPSGLRWSQHGFADKASAQRAARHSARFYDRIERDRVDGIESVPTTKVLERGLRLCTKCGEPHDLVATTRRGRRFGQTWAAPGCGTYQAESWEDFARRTVAERAEPVAA